MRTVKITLTFILLFLHNISCAQETATQKNVEVFISNECKSWFYGPFDDVEKLPNLVPWDPSLAKSIVYKDLRTKITFYVESDGRHLVAISSDGKILWIRNPFEEWELCPYRTPKPVISRIVASELPEYFIKNKDKFGLNTSHRFLSISFDSSQTGLIDEQSGDFLFLGQN